MFSYFKWFRKMMGGKWYVVERTYYPDTGSARRKEYWSEREYQKLRNNAILWKLMKPTTLEVEDYE